MKLEIRTEEFKDAISKVKGISSKKVIIDILNGIELKTEGNNLIITGTDSINFVESTVPADIEEHGRVVVDAKRFISLVQNTTTNKIKIVQKDNYLELKGNGTYKIEIMQEDDYAFPQIVSMDDKEVIKIENKNLQDALNILKSAISNYSIHDYVDGYMITKDAAYSTDMVRFMKYSSDIFNDDISVGIPNSIAEYLKLLNGEFITIEREENNLIFKNDKIRVFCREMQDKDKFPPYDTIISKLNLTWEGNISCTEFIDALNRLTIFTEDIEGSIIIIEVSDDSILMWDRKGKKATESIECENINNKGNKLEIGVDAELLIPILKSMSKDDMILKLGEKNPIMVMQDNIEGIVAPFYENEDEE